MFPLSHQTGSFAINRLQSRPHPGEPSVALHAQLFRRPVQSSQPLLYFLHWCVHMSPLLRVLLDWLLLIPDGHA